jgi:de-etiolated-1
MKFKSEGNPSDFAGLETGANDGHAKLVAFLFHPIFPFVISVQQSLLQATIVNFHFRR